jgi:hypothetical protein
VISIGLRAGLGGAGRERMRRMSNAWSRNDGGV